MRQIEKSVFISYRRTNAAWALAVSQHLTHHGYDVFFDFTGIGSGDFERVILANIRARAHFLVLLTPSAIERCDRPDDWLRHEIETALDAKRNVVPITLEGFNFSEPAIAAKLTGTIASLKNYNAIRVPVDYFDEAMERLRSRYLDLPLDTVLHPVPAPVQRMTEDQQRAAADEPVVQTQELTAQEYFERGVEASGSTQKMSFYDEAIRLKPDYPEALNYRGRARQASGDLIGALQDYDEAIRLKPTYLDALNNRGSAREAQGDLEGARQDYDTALRMKPGALQAIPNSDLVNYSGAFDGRMRVKFAQGDVAGCINDLEDSDRLDNALLQRMNAEQKKMDELHARGQKALRDLIGQLDVSAELGDERARESAKKFRLLLDPNYETIHTKRDDAGLFSKLRCWMESLWRRLTRHR